MKSEVSVSRLARERLDRLEPLWAALYDYQQQASPALRDRARTLDDSWRDRRALEERWLSSEPRSFALVAAVKGVLAGYAFVRVITGPLAVSWEFSDPYAELATLSVAPRYRGQGVGTALMDAVHAELREQGIGDLAIGVITANTRAAQFYERLGAVPFLTTYVQRVPAPTAPRER